MNQTRKGLLQNLRLQQPPFRLGLCVKRNHVLHNLNMAQCDSVMSNKFYVSYERKVLYHLTDDGAGLTGSQRFFVVVYRILS